MTSYQILIFVNNSNLCIPQRTELKKIEKAGYEINYDNYKGDIVVLDIAKHKQSYDVHRNGKNPVPLSVFIHYGFPEQFEVLGKYTGTMTVKNINSLFFDRGLLKKEPIWEDIYTQCVRL